MFYNLRALASDVLKRIGLLGHHFRLTAHNNTFKELETLCRFSPWGVGVGVGDNFCGILECTTFQKEAKQKINAP